MQTPSSTAARLAARFSTLDNGRVIFTADEPDHETLIQMVFNANEAGISNDYAYSMVRDVLNLLSDSDEIEDAVDIDDMDPDCLVDVYNADLMRFISDGTNWTFADEAREEIGEWPGDDFMGIVRAAQYHAYRAALHAVAANWPDDEQGA